MKEKLNVAIVGLGLMGGSLAWALRGFKNCELIGYDIDPTATEKALAAGCIDKGSNTLNEAVAHADIVIFCASPHAVTEGIRAPADNFKRGAVVAEICGVKHSVAQIIASLLPDDVEYIGIHPMAGKEVSGFDNADGALFRGAGFILTSTEGCSGNTVSMIKEMLAYVGAGRVVSNTPEEHDDIIAYTSDLMHISATALCATYPKNMTLAHTAGAFRDCTRIANIDANLWTELFLANRPYILPHLSDYIGALESFRKSLESKNSASLHAFLERASQNKREMQSLLRTIDVNLDRHPYLIRIGKDMVDNAGEIISKMYPMKKAVVVSDENVWQLYGGRLMEIMKAAGVLVHPVIVPPGEESKSMAQLEQLLHAFCDVHLSRDEPVIAFGGGVVGDLTGFAAATYMRGVPFVQIPTSLLAQVDSSVGGKVAIDLGEGKNIVGNFYQPDAVIIDTSFLKTLPEREFATGMAEIIKHAAIGQQELLAALESTLLDRTQAEAMADIVCMNCVIKVSFVEQDEKDYGRRHFLNFGHTFAHAIEAYYEYKKYNHGEAVALGMVLAVKTGILLGKTAPDTLDRLVALLSRYGLPTALEEDVVPMLPLMTADKKNVGGKITLILLSKMGNVFEEQIELAELQRLLGGK